MDDAADLVAKLIHDDVMTAALHGQDYDDAISGRILRWWGHEKVHRKKPL